MLKRFLSATPFSSDLGLLILRLGIGFLMLTHGWPKLTGYSERINSFADPYGFGSATSLTLAVFAEVVCSLLVLFGLFTRFALIPLMITMLTIILIVHGADPFGKKELPLLYFIAYVTLFLTGPGKYSLDALTRNKKR